MKETFGLRIEKDDKEWIMSHSNPQDFMRKLIHQARYPPATKHAIIDERYAYDYEAFEKQGVDCRFGSYVPHKKKVLCQCHYNSIIKAGLGKNKLVDPWVCEACFNSERLKKANEGSEKWFAEHKEKLDGELTDYDKQEKERYEKGLRDAERIDAKNKR